MNFYDEAMADSDIRTSPESVAFYIERRNEGMSRNFAAMLACQRFPGTNTEVAYFEGRHTLADQFKGNDGQLRAVVAAARARGYNPGVHDVYEPGLADNLGDPKAFIKPSGGTTELRRKLEAAGKSCHGHITVKGRAPRGPGKAGSLAPDLVQEIAMRKLQENPDLKHKMKPREMVEQINHEHGYRDSSAAGQFSSPHIPDIREVVKAAPPEKTRPKKPRRPWNRESRSKV